MTAHNGPLLEVSLDAIARNYGLMQGRLKSGRAGAVVKANAYGLGVLPIAPKLYDAGCRDFFVATLAEAIELREELDKDIEPRAILPETRIYVFHGLRKSEKHEFLAHRITPVLNDLGQIDLWNAAGDCAIHIDTGMCRLGLTPGEAENVDKKKLSTLRVILSHLACGSDAKNPKNREQLELFHQELRHFPGIPVSFANSSGILLGPDYHFDLARPGRALYGIARGTTMPDGLENVAKLSAPVLQYRTTTSPQTVSYGATANVEKGTVLGTFEMGYADGFMRSLSHKIYGYVDDIKVPILGLVSMDMIIADLTAVPEHLRGPDLRLTLIGKEQPIDVVADAADTIGYEIFTRIGRRVKKLYI